MGNSFKAGGQTWIIAVTVGGVTRVKSATDIDISKALDENFAVLNKLLGDVCSLVDVVYLLVKPQADAMGITAEQFGEMIASGETVEEMADAFMSGLLDFFPKRQREIMTSLHAKSKVVADLLAKDVTTKLNELTPSMLSDLLMNSQESAESTPTA